MEKAIKRIQQVAAGRLTLSGDSKIFLNQVISDLINELIIVDNVLEKFEESHRIFTMDLTERTRKETIAKLDRYFNKDTTFKKPRKVDDLDWYSGLLFPAKLIKEYEVKDDRQIIIISSIIQSVLEQIFQDVKEFTNTKITKDCLSKLSYLH